MIRITTYLCILLAVSMGQACSPTKPQKWWLWPHNEWPQIVLTNQLHFAGRQPVQGASAFIFYYDNDTLLATARHVLEEPMGIQPPVPQDSVNSLLKNWSLAPRATASFDSLRVSHLLNTTPASDDFLILALSHISEQVRPLVPFGGQAAVGDTVYLVGCEHQNPDCRQEVFEAVVVRVKDDFTIKPLHSFAAAGFSGAPVVNARGEAIGLATAYYQGDEGFFIYLEPMEKLLAFLKAMEQTKE